MAPRVRLGPAGFDEELSCCKGRIATSAELEPPDHLGEADLDPEQSKAMAVDIDDPPVKPRISGSSPLPASSRTPAVFAAAEAAPAACGGPEGKLRGKFTRRAEMLAALD